MASLIAAAFASQAFSGAVEGGYPFDATVLYLAQDDKRANEDAPCARKAVEQARELLASKMEKNGCGKGRTFNYEQVDDFRVHYEKRKM